MIFGLKTNAIFSNMEHVAGCGCLRKKRIRLYSTPQPERAWRCLELYLPIQGKWSLWMQQYLMLKQEGKENNAGT